MVSKLLTRPPAETDATDHHARSAIWGARPVGYFAIQSAKLMGAGTIIAIETVPERIALAKRAGAKDVIDFDKEDVYGRIIEISGGKGAGSIVQKGLTMRSGQTHVKRYLEPLTKLIQEKKVDMTSLITHRSTKLEDGPDLYKTFRDKKDGCTKVVFHPFG